MKDDQSIDVKDKLSLALNVAVNTNTRVMRLLTEVIAAGTENFNSKKSYDRVRTEIKRIGEWQDKQLQEIFKDEQVAE